MALRIDTFEQAAAPAVLQRGRTYFRAGHIVGFSYDHGEVNASVQGTQMYRVTMEVDDDGTIRQHRCTCPYEDGLLCKHEVAVLYRLQSVHKNAARKAQMRNLIAQMQAPKKPLWEEALDDLLTPLQAAATTPLPQPQPANERMLYVIELFRDGYKIHPHRQKILKSGRWGKPTSASIKTFIEQGYPFMDAVDRHIREQLATVIKGQYYYSYYDSLLEHLENYLPFLVGTDKVRFRQRGRKTFQPVQVTRERAYLTIERKADKLFFSSNVTLDKKGTAVPSPCILVEDPTHCIVIELTPYEQKAYSTLLRLGAVPKEAEPKLRQFIAAVSNHLEIHSDLIEGGSTLEHVPGDATVLLRLNPKRGEFMLDCCVQPLQGGRLRFFPGQGKPSVFDDKNGTRYQVERDMDAERQRLQSLNDFAEHQLHIVLSPEPQTLGIEDVLRLMEFVSQYQKPAADSRPYAIEWLDGAKLNIRQPLNADSYAMGLRTKQNWFELEGTLQLDEQTILSAAELLRLMQKELVGKRFIRLNNSEFIALNERLAKQLDHVRQLAQINRNRVLIPRYEIGLLGEMMSRPETILREDKGVRDLLQRIDNAAHMPVPVPQGLQATLRDYQAEGFRWMMRLAEWGAGACLADDMGLGKTVQTIAVLLARAGKGPSLVVAPASVLYNWQSEMQRFAPTLNVHVLNEMSPDGTGERARVASRGKGEKYSRRPLIASLQPYDVLLTTYGLLVREEKALTDKTWNVVCLDEAHTIKNRATKMSQAAMCLRADARIALTGTPLQNYLSELWNLFQFIDPGLLGSYESFSHDFITPIESDRDQERQALLRRIIRPFLLRRTKAEVIDELPEKTEITRRIQLTPDERIAYEAMRIEAQQQVEQADKVDMNVLASITRLRQAACSLDLVHDSASLSTDGGSKLADFAELLSQIVTGGNRVLVFSQFTSFLQMAQAKLSTFNSQLDNVPQLSTVNSQLSTFNSQLSTFNSQLSTFNSQLSTVNSQLSTLYLDGATPLNKRKQMVEAFQRGEAQVFFISLKAGGLGLNLTAANYVIHLDPWWNPAIEQQATDRAYRIGQQRNVTVYHLIAADTIEEKILRLHKTKRDLADALLQNQNTTHALTLSDLKELLASSNPSSNPSSDSHSDSSPAC
jgi:superfamily II DNA or RNA helicase